MSLTKAHNRMLEGASISISDYGASESNTNAENKTALDAAIAACDAQGGGVVVVPPRINYGYDRNDLTTQPDFSGCSNDIVVIDYGIGNSYSLPSKDGAQVRYFMGTAQTTPVDLHDGNFQFLRGKWHPGWFIMNDSALAPVGDPSRTADDKRMASVFFGNDGTATWRVGQGNNAGAGLTDDELSSFLIAANDLAGGSGLTNCFTISKATAKMGFHYQTPANAYDFYMRAVSANNIAKFTAESGFPEIVLEPSAGDEVRFKSSSAGAQIAVDSGNWLTVDGTGRFLLGDAATYNAGFNVEYDRANNYAVHIKNTSSTAGSSALRVNSSTNDSNTYLIWGVGSTTNTFRVEGDGDVYNTNNTYGAISDAKLKKDISPASSQWDDIKALQVKNYTLIDDPTETVQLGVVAQDLEQTSPNLVVDTPDRDDEGNDLGTTTKAVKYSVLHMKALKALQEAMDRIEQLEARIAALET